MEENKYKRGSEWRRWDLHVHTPASDGTGSPNEIVDTAISKGISVLAITDHHTVEYIDQVKDYAKDKDISIISGIEFRSEYGGRSVHFIAYFPEKNGETILDSTALHNLVLSKLGVSKTEIVAKGRESDSTLNESDAFKKGMFLVQVDMKLASNIVHSLGGIISVHNGNKENGLDEEVKHFGGGKTNVHSLYESLGTLKEELMKKYIDICDIGASDNERDRLFYLESFNRPSIVCSDAHSYSDIGNSFTWIKADPTFEGLKQILYEPESRVRIQETNPALDFEKSPLTEINISENIEVFNEESDNVSFKACTLLLNNNLVSIIGGRGTGKSLLIDYISHFLGRNSTNDNYRGSSNLIVKRKTSLAEAEKSFALDSVQEQFPFIYIPQSEVKEIVKDTDKFSESILSTIGINKEYSPDETLTDNIRQNLSNYITLYNELNKDNTSAHAKKENIDNQIKNNQNLISNITSEENRERLQSYKGQLEKLSKMNSLIDKLNTLSKTLQEFQGQTNIEIESLNEDEEFKNSKIAISPISLGESLDDIKNVITYFEEQKGNVDSEIQKTKEQFSGYKGDLASLLDNVKTYQERVEELKQEKLHIETKEKQLEECKNKFSEYGNCIEQSLNDYKVNIEGVWQQFKNGKEGFDDKQKTLLNKIIGAEKSKIEVEIQIDFDSNKLYENILDKLDKRSWKRQYLEQQLNINDFHSYIDCIKNANIRIFDNINLKDIQNEVLKTLFTDFIQYVRHKPIVKSDGKDIRKLSHGQRGTTYLRLKLASNLLSQTIIYDQPEDDLDNEFIISELVDIFKEIKKYRQVIIVSHNANLVVNADSEQIIVAKNENGVLSYYSGSLEDPSINSDICRVLEGGQEAFQKRENKYGFKQ